MKWKLVSVRLEIVLNAPYAHKSVWMDLLVLLGDVDEVEAHFSPFLDSDNLEAR